MRRLAMIAVVAWHGVARGQDATIAECPAPTPFLMDGAAKIGLGPTLEEYRLHFSGWLEQGFTANTQQPHDNTNALRAFDDRSNAYRFNQLVLAIERPLADGPGTDIGGKIELLYGSDGRFTQAEGLEPGDAGDTLQFDPVEFYASARVPIGRGVTIKTGKFVTPIGLEVIDAPGNALYSHSFLFTFAEPFTHAGISLSYPITDRWSAAYSLVRGSDVWDDDNDEPSHLVSTTWTSADQVLVLAGNVMTGPEQDDDDHDDRTLVDFVGTWRWSDRLSTSVNADYAYEEGAAHGGPGRWWGVAGYATYAIDPRLSCTGRAEYFVDRDGSRTGFTADLWEITAGLDLHPFASTRNVRLRPEVRWDHAAGDDPFDDGTRSDQVTFGVDLILTF